MRQIAHRLCGPARIGPALRVAGCAAVLLAAEGAPVRAQANPPDPLALVIEPLLQSESAEVRGEAALALAATGDPRYQDRILALTRDPAAPARTRAIVAAGILGQPGADPVLARILEEGKRGSLEPLLAALALGLLPDEPRVPAVDEFFSKAQASSRRRIRDPLICMLLGLRHGNHPQRITVLRGYMTDATYRHRPELALVIDILARLPGEENLAAIRKQLDARNTEILAATLRALRTAEFRLDEESAKHVVRIADRADKSDLPELSALALDLLAFHRHPDALTIAARCLGASEPTQRAAAIRAILKLGGGLLRESIENRILATGEPRLQAAMLDAKSGPHTDSFVQACLLLSRDSARPLELRVAAAKVVAEAGWKKIEPTLVELFHRAADLPAADSLARSMRRIDMVVDGTALPMHTATDLERLPVRLRALLSSGVRGSRAILFRLLTNPAGTAMQIDALRAYRSARVQVLDARAALLVPEAVLEIIGR